MREREREKERERERERERGSVCVYVYIYRYTYIYIYLSIYIYMINMRTLTKPHVKDGVRMVHEWGGMCQQPTHNSSSTRHVFLEPSAQRQQ